MIQRNGGRRAVYAAAGRSSIGHASRAVGRSAHGVDVVVRPLSDELEAFARWKREGCPVPRALPC